MTDPVTGVQAPAAGEQGQGTGPAAQPAGQPAATPPAGQPAGQPAAQPGGQPATPAGEQKQVTVPLSVVEAVRKELSEAKASKTEIEAKLNQLQMMSQMGGFGQPGQPAQPAAPAAQPAQPEDPLSGMEDDELINAKDIRKILQTVQGNRPDLSKEIEPLHMKIAKIEVQAADPNYEKTIRTYLPEMITVNPVLRDMITRAPNPLAAALTVAKMSPKFVQAQQAAANPANPEPPADILSDLQKIIENATKPGTPGAMGGGGAISGNDRFRTMNDADFDAEVNRVLTQGAQ